MDGINMKRQFLAVSALLLMSATSAKADCEKVVKENFSAEFSVNSITKDQTAICGFDPSGAFYDKIFRIPVRGCVVELSILKFKKGSHEPAVNIIADKKIKIYSESAFCDKKVGAKLKLKVQSTATECCQVAENQKGSEYQYCTKDPTPQFIKELPEENIRCGSEGRRWKIVERK